MLGLALTLAAALPAVGLDHFYVVLDQPTYDAVRASGFVTEELAAVDGGLTHAGTPLPRASSLYVRGRDTYLELLGPNNRTGAPAGSCGLALASDEPGALAKLEPRLRRLVPGLERRTVPLDAGERPIPWYDLLVVAEAGAWRLAWWVTQYRPEFMQAILHTASISRRSYLARLYDPHRLLDNVVELTLALTPREAKPFCAELRALGFRETNAAAGVLLDGAGVRLRILTQARASGPPIVSATLALHRPLTQTIVLGNSRIEADGGRALWRFAPDPSATPPQP